MPSQPHLPRQLLLVVVAAVTGVWAVPTVLAFSPTVFGRLITTSTTTIIMGPTIDSIRRIHTIMEATAVHDTNNDSNNQNAKDLSECTIPELWEIVTDSNLMRKGLKSRLVRKQDIIDYLLVEEQQQSKNAAAKVSPATSLEEKPDYPDDFLFHVQLPPQMKNNVSPLVRDNMVERGITSLLPIQIEAYSEIYLGNDVVLQAPTGSGTLVAPTTVVVW
jgi:ATP-dependent helicase YprA (DUF1998 family)